MPFKSSPGIGLWRDGLENCVVIYQVSMDAPVNIDGSLSILVDIMAEGIVTVEEVKVVTYLTFPTLPPRSS